MVRYRIFDKPASVSLVWYSLYCSLLSCATTFIFAIGSYTILGFLWGFVMLFNRVDSEHINLPLSQFSGLANMAIGPEYGQNSITIRDELNRTEWEVSEKVIQCAMWLVTVVFGDWCGYRDTDKFREAFALWSLISSYRLFRLAPFF